MSEVDVYVSPFDYADAEYGHHQSHRPAVCSCATLFSMKRQPTSLTFVSRVFGEADMLAAARAYQEATDWHLKTRRCEPLLVEQAKDSRAPPYFC